MSYSNTDPEFYDRRHELIPREKYLFDHWNPIIRNAVKKYCIDNGNALDLGCGTGTNFMPMLKGKADKVLGIDLSLNFLIYGKRKDKNLDLVYGDAHRLPLKNESMDMIISNLFEFVDRGLVVDEMRRVLNKDGICIVQTLNKHSIYSVPSKLYEKLLRKDHGKKEASKGEMIYIFKNTGFELIECRLDDGLIWLPHHLDRMIGPTVYSGIEKVFKVLGENPFSNVMLFVAKKK